MTHDIVIDWDTFISAGMAIRGFAFVFGTALVLHILCMATMMSNRAPWTLAILMGMNAATAFGIVIGAVSGDLMFLANSAVMAIGADTARQLYLWSKGMHVSEFIEQRYG